MKLSERVKPVSYLKAHTDKVIRELSTKRGTMVITQNGEAKFIVQDIKTYEQTQETMALLKILALGNKEIEDGRIEPATEVFKRIRNLHK